MPSSEATGKPFIAKVINSLIESDDFIVLDLGCGKGTYGRLIKKPCIKIGVDAIDYAEKYALMDIYNDFKQFDIRETDKIKAFGHVNLSIAGDVLEHVSVRDAQRILATLKQISDYIVVALPFKYEQIGRYGNHWEDHIQSDLTPENVKERYPDLVPIAIYKRSAMPWNGGPYYGYYMWAKKLSLT